MTKNNIGLVEHCKIALSQGWLYGWGTWGQKATPELINRICKQYPSTNNPKRKIFMEQAIKYNTCLCDCYGLVKGYLFKDCNNNYIYNSKYDINTDNAFNRAKEKGTIATLPEQVGIVLYMKGHVGVYIGNGQFIECADYKRADLGKIQNGKIIKGSRFTHWFKDVNILYNDGSPIEPKPEPNIILDYLGLPNGDGLICNYINYDNITYINFRDFFTYKCYNIVYNDVLNEIFLYSDSSKEIYKPLDITETITPITTKSIKILTFSINNKVYKVQGLNYSNYNFCSVGDLLNCIN